MKLNEYVCEGCCFVLWLLVCSQEDCWCQSCRAAENHLRQTDTEHQHSLTPFLFTVALHPEASRSSTWFVNTTVVVMGLDFIHYISVIIMKCCSVSLLSQIQTTMWRHFSQNRRCNHSSTQLVRYEATAIFHICHHLFSFVGDGVVSRLYFFNYIFFTFTPMRWQSDSVNRYSSN